MSHYHILLCKTTKKSLRNVFKTRFIIHSQLHVRNILVPIMSILRQLFLIKYVK